MLNELLFNFWLKIPSYKKADFLRKLKIAVIAIWVLAILAGFFAAYRFGEYMQAKRQNVIIEVR